MIDHCDRIEISSRGTWRGWLAVHCQQTASIWLVSWKKGDPRFVPYADLRDEALCWGWIDSRPAKLDAARTMLRMSPRRRGSRWSAINKARVSALEAEGRMTGAGRTAIEAAQADGSWNALDDLDRVPADLAAALAAANSADWDGLAPSLQRGLLERLLDAKRPETRARRIAELVARAQATVGRS